MTPQDSLVQALAAKEHWDLLRRMDGADKAYPGVDNVAVLFSNMEAVMEFHSFCLQAGWTMFNNSIDHVTGALGHEDYDVQFWFLRDPDNPMFRIESMFLPEPENSQIHGFMLRARGQGCVAQGSYKGDGENTVNAFQRENAFLQTMGFSLEELFISRYGPYTYWNHPGVDDDYGFLKVRLNWRDK